MKQGANRFAGQVFQQARLRRRVAEGRRQRQDILRRAGATDPLASSDPQLFLVNVAAQVIDVAEELATEGTRDPEGAIAQAKRFLEAGAYMIMIESEGITENVKTWRTDVPAKIANALGIEKVMFEAADPEVFAWYIKNYGPEVNLFVDHSQVVQLECLRSGIWGTKSLWGRVVTYRG